jgi:UDP-glucose 4-epimerase
MGPSTTGRWSYACSKAIDEFLALAYWKERKLPTVVARLFDTVGPRQTGRYGMVVPKFVSAALSGRPLMVFGDGTQTRCFCHVSDVVRALVDLMELGDGAYGQVFNIGSQEEISIMSLADRVRERTGSNSGIHVIPYEEGFEDMPRRLPDITKIEAAVGWQATRSVDEILGDVMSWQQAEAAVV